MPPSPGLTQFILSKQATRQDMLLLSGVRAPRVAIDFPINVRCRGCTLTLRGQTVYQAKRVVHVFVLERTSSCQL